MIDIHTLSEEERKVLCANVEPWFPRYGKPMAFKGQFHNLKKIINLPNSDKEVWAFVCCITKAIRYNNHKSYMSFSSEIYNASAKIKKYRLNNRKMTAICNKLEEIGYLTRYLGFKFENDSSCSILVFHEKLLNLFDQYLCQKFGQARDLCQIECHETTYKLNSNGKETKVKTVVDLKGKHGLGVTKSSLYNFNKLLEDTEVDVDWIVRQDLVFKRVFESDLNGAGRWYSVGDFQSLSKSEREKIHIKKKNVCSVDYTATHPNIIRTLLQIPTPVDHDPYTIDVSFPCCKDELRSLCKVGLMCILYNRSKGKATQALASKLTQDKFVTLVSGAKIPREIKDQKYPSITNTKGVAREVIDKLTQLNNDLEPMFFVDKLWALLQGYDAKIAQCIIDHFTNKGILVLPWHDGFVIDSDYQDELCQVMKDSWINILGDDTHCKMKVEFSNRNFKFKVFN